MALKKKTTSQTAVSPKKQIIKVNPYENPENVMELMAGICSATPSADTDIYRGAIIEAYNKKVGGMSLCDYLTENRGNLLNVDFEHDLYAKCQELSWSLTARENTEHTQVVVAGGFSSGKSSFLNRLTGCVNLLPTGVEPVSVVKTYLYCSKNCKSVSVKGVNQKNVLVNLNPGVLQAIQHAKQSNIYLASVLEKLFVEVPASNLDGLVFIDTPGYNNSDKANQSNGKTDRETALEALGEGNVLFWLVDCERGTTVSNDIEIIKQFNGKKLFIFNKADKKGPAECKKIVDDAAKTLYKEFPTEEIIDIIAFSTLDNKVYYSKNKGSNSNALESIINCVKQEGNGNSELNKLKDEVADLFDVEISACENTIKNIEDEYKEKLNEKKKLQKEYTKAKEDKETILEELTSINYKQARLCCINDGLERGAAYMRDSFYEFYDDVLYFENNDHWGSSKILTSALNKATQTYNESVKRIKKELDLFTEDLIDDFINEELLEIIISHEDDIVEDKKDRYDWACDNCKESLERKKYEENMKSVMTEYRNVFMSGLEIGIKQYQQKNKATTVNVEEYSIPNVFECIKKDDYKSFLRSFEEGVDMTICNADGYNPMTLAVSMGNNAMVQFLLDHDADPQIKDKRGYNAFHTAVENQFRDICKILLDVDPELINTETNSGESVADLASKQSFSKWIEDEIDNAF
ncbi:MAG: ankyrin repeat domain-containing protein [Bacteroidia bacterium]|nr:ankyrin repeat domain-containing protein [Bacteroidia bacterium]